MADEEKMELEPWAPSSFEEYNGTDMIPDMRPAGALAPVGGLVGRENIEPEDLVLPSMLLLQGMSEPVTGGEQGAQPGNFWLTTAGEVFKPPLRVILVHHSRSRALFPQPNNPRTSELKKCLARAGVKGTVYGICDNCEHTAWGPRNEPPACSESHNFVAWTQFGPCVLRLAKTSFKAARNFLTTWRMSNKNLWAHPCIFTVKKQQRNLSDGQNVTFFSMDMRWQQKEDVPPDYQRSALELHGQIKEAHEAGRFTSDQEEFTD
jgi:hypothetical protein